MDSIEEAGTSVADAAENAVSTVAETTMSIFHVEEIRKLLTFQNMLKAAIGIVTVIVFYIIYRIVRRTVSRRAAVKMQPHNAMIVNKTVSYVFYVLIAMYILSLFGVDLSAIWGAAGVAGLAIGFAAQTSVSNLISGVFVLSDKTLKVGDYISVGGESGIVDTIGLLSIKIHTLDNQLIRIPNSTIINSNLMNYSQYPLRRFVFDIPVSYEADMEKELETIRKVPDRCPSVLKDPEPAIFYDGFGDVISLKMAVWFNRSDLAKVKNEVYTEIVKVCREDGLEIPYTRYDIHLVNEDK